MALELPERSRYRMPPAWFARTAPDLAVALLGKRLTSLVHGQLTCGRIVETEAYLPHGDSACHAARGCTPGNRSMFGVAGRAYVYPIHSRVCFNVVCGLPDQGTAVLIRALQPLSGINAMVARRNRDNIGDLCRGPGRLCQSLAIDRTDDGSELSGGARLWIDHYDSPDISDHQIRQTVRTGVTSARDLPLRFVIAGNPWVSGPARLR